MRERGRLFTVHVRSRDFRYVRAVEEALDVARRAGVATQLSHLTARYGALRDADRAVWGLVARARDEGLDVTCDQHPFTTSNAAATSVLPPWAFDGGREALRARLADPAVRADLKAYREPQNKLIVAGQWELISLVAAPHRPDLLGRPLDVLAAEREGGGGDPYDVLFDAMLAELDAGDDPTGVRLWAERYVDEEVLRGALSHPLFMFASDGQVLAPDGPLEAVRNPYSYGWVPRFLGTYVRERGWLPLEDAVRRLTSFPARKLGLADRGLISAGHVGRSGRLRRCCAAPQRHGPGPQPLPHRGAGGLRQRRRRPPRGGDHRRPRRPGAAARMSEPAGAGWAVGRENSVRLKRRGDRRGGGWCIDGEHTAATAEVQGVSTAPGSARSPTG